MLHLLYVIAFTILAVLAVGNLIRNLVTLNTDSQRRPTDRSQSPLRASSSSALFPAHPELVDKAGNYINEPLLVMRSMTVEDAREQLDALYKASPGNNEKDVWEE